MSFGRTGVMNRVNTVRSGWRAAKSATIGSTRSIHGVVQGPSAEKMRCMSTQRCTVRAVNGYERSSSATAPLSGYFAGSDKSELLISSRALLLPSTDLVDRRLIRQGDEDENDRNHDGKSK